MLKRKVFTLRSRNHHRVGIVQPALNGRFFPVSECLFRAADVKNPEPAIPDEIRQKSIRFAPRAANALLELTIVSQKSVRTFSAVRMMRTSFHRFLITLRQFRIQRNDLREQGIERFLFLIA